MIFVTNFAISELLSRYRIDIYFLKIGKVTPLGVRGALKKTIVPLYTASNQAVTNTWHVVPIH